MTDQNEFDDYEQRFHFIDESVLRQNLAESFRHVAELAAITTSYPEDLKPLFYKSIIIHAASMVEAGLHHLLRKVINEPVYETQWTYRHPKVIYELEDTEEELERSVIGSTRFKKQINLGNHVQFRDINNICKKLEIFPDEKTFEKVEKLRELRNKIHLSGLSEVDRGYSLATVDGIFETAREVFGIIETKLGN